MWLRPHEQPSGQRVAKAGPSGTLIYVYDAAGQLIAEYASAATAAAPCTTCYLSTDHLRTTQLITDENANVISRHDFFPFGEEVPANQVGRDAHFGSGNDTVSQKFTGQMRDTETGEDYLNARMFGSTIGRFTSPDPRNAGADSKNHQSWNGYAYVINNPLNDTDSTGKFKDAWFDGTPACFMCGGGGGVVSYSGDAGTLGTYNSNSRGSDFIRSPNSLGGNYAQGEASYLDLVQQAFQGLQNPAIPAPNNGPLPPDRRSCAARLAAGVLKNTGVSITNIQQGDTIGGHTNYTFDVADPTGFQNILNNNPPFNLPFGIDKGYRYGTVQSTHVENTLTGGLSGRTDLFSGHSFLAPLHFFVDVGIGHIPGVNLDFGCKAGS